MADMCAISSRVLNRPRLAFPNSPRFVITFMPCAAKFCLLRAPHTMRPKKDRRACLMARKICSRRLDPLVFEVSKGTSRSA